MKFVADTGALLSLACSQHFDTVFAQYTIIVTPAVVAELKLFAKYTDFLGSKAEIILKQKLSVQQPSVVQLDGVSAVEQEVISIANEHHFQALSDDVRASRIAKNKHNIDVKPSLYLLLLRYKHRKIKKHELIADIEQILQRRNWLSGALWNYASQLIAQL